MLPHAHVTCCHPRLLTESQASFSTKQPYRHRVGAQDCHRLQAVPTGHLSVELGASARVCVLSPGAVHGHHQQDTCPTWRAQQ